MTAAQQRSPSAVLLGAARHPVVLWCAFLLVHLLLGLLNLVGDGYPLNDVTGVYKFWIDGGIVANFWVGIDGPWVYPVGAIIPMLLAHLTSPIAAAMPGMPPSDLGAGLYGSTWLVLVTLLNSIAFGIVTGWGRRPDRISVGWWWVGFLALLGPIALGRIDSITVPIALVGVSYIATRPRAAAILLMAAAWIKVWPGALVIAMVVASRERWRVLGVAVATSAIVVGIALSLGSGSNVFSFVTQQTGRGLQVEAPISTFWMWQAAAHLPGASVYYDTDILTWQVRGQGVAVASALMTPLLLIIVAVIAALGVRAVRRGASAAAVLPPLMLAILVGMIAFQKVGSPQFISWLAVPVVLGLISHRAGSAAGFRVPAVLVLVLGALTQIIYPALYGYVLGLFPAMLLVLTLRNVLLFVVLGWAIVAIVRSSQRKPDAGVAGATAVRELVADR